MSKLVAVGLFCQWALLALLATACDHTPPAPALAPPTIERVDSTEVTISWQTDRPSIGRVLYRLVGTEGRPRAAVEPPPAAESHRVVLTGLEPGKRYRYWLAGTEQRYEFRSRPLHGTPFSVLFVWGDVSDRIATLVASETPDFVVSLSPSQPGAADGLRAIRSSLLVLDPKPSTWSWEWAGLHLAFLDTADDLGDVLDASEAHTLGLVLQAEGLDPAALKDLGLHGILTDHNREHPSRPVSFVLVCGESQLRVQVDGIVYAGLPVQKAQTLAGAMRLDVGPEATVAHYLDRGTEVVLRQSKLKRRRTCKECRQLADRGAYEESVKAYQQFIADNEGHYQIDDAHYAIGEILDERLFRFAEALTWYRKLVDQYPHSTLTALARQRIDFLTTHADYDFEPLARFERIRKVEFARQKDKPAELQKVLAATAQIIADYPDSALAPEMSYWLANQYRSLDPDRAVAIYRELIERYPSFAGREDAHIEIGETYYDAQRYAEAIAAFVDARAAVPSRAAAIDAQIQRSQRNQRRGRLAWTGWAMVALLLAPGLIGRQRRISRRDWRRAGIAFVLLACLNLAGGWLIHEQFTSVGELFGLALIISAAAGLGFPFVTALARQLLRIGPREQRRLRLLLSSAVGLVMGLALLLSAAYLAIFHLNPHYLTGFGL